MSKKNTSTWTGRLYQSALLSLFTVVFNTITIYLFYPVTMVMKQRWICKHTIIDGKSMEFYGQTKDIMWKWLFYWFLIIITVSVFGFLLPNKMQKWKAENTHFVN